MELIKILLLILISLIMIVGFFWYFVCYSTHIEMNKKESLPYDFVHFSTFIKIFEKYKEDLELEYEQEFKSIFLRRDDKYIVYLHASIVKFSDKCMIFYPISWIRYRLWMNSNFKDKNYYRKKNLWTNR